MAIPLRYIATGEGHVRPKHQMKINTVIVKPILLMAAAISLIMFPGVKLPYADKSADAYFKDSITKAGVAYGVCRVINASVSVVKDSQIEVQPAGLGVSLAAGQVLDPLDDITERASDILIAAIVSLGIQKIAYELCVAFAPLLIGIAMLVLVVISFLKGDRAMALRSVFLNVLIVLAAARLCLPISSIVNSYLNANYFEPQITTTKNELSMVSPEKERLKDMRMPEINGVLGTVENGFKFVGEKTSDLRKSINEMIRNMESMVSNLLKLSYLYLALFLVQVILLPFGAFWLLARSANALFVRTSHIPKHSDLISRQ